MLAPNDLIPESASKPGRNYAAALPDRHVELACAPRLVRDSPDG